MGLLLFLVVAAVGVAAGAMVAKASPGRMPAPPGPPPRPPGRGDPEAPRLPIPSANDWQGWVWPVPITDGRIPVITQEWKPGHDPGFGQSSSKHANHLGVDIMFRKGPGDSPEPIKHLASKAFIAPEGTKVVAAGPGKIWSTFFSPAYGHGIVVNHGTVSPQLGGVVTFYQHLEKFARDWKKGDHVEPGTVLGDMGYAPSDTEGLRHLHFELWFPRKGTPQDSWRIDAAPYMRFWRKLDV